MNPNIQAIFKSLSPKIAARALQTFDRATTIVVSACWGAAILMMVFAVYGVMLASSARHAADTAAAAEPVLPQIVRKPLDAHDTQPLVERLQHRYTGISFALGNDQSLSVTSSDGSKFREWITLLGYIDTISPRYRWSIKEFCVGKCVGSSLMRAVLTGEKISFDAPEAGAKH